MRAMRPDSERMWEWLDGMLTFGINHNERAVTRDSFFSFLYNLFFLTREKHGSWGQCSLRQEHRDKVCLVLVDGWRTDEDL